MSSPPTRRSGPHRQEGPATNVVTANPSLTDGTEVPAQLRRRHDAALRLAPLKDGLRDPWLATRPPLSRESALAAWGHLAALGLGSDVVASALGLREVA